MFLVCVRGGILYVSHTVQYEPNSPGLQANIPACRSARSDLNQIDILGFLPSPSQSHHHHHTTQPCFPCVSPSKPGTIPDLTSSLNLPSLPCFTSIVVRTCHGP